ncbi:type IV secretory system conjugative DNA transfer family protein [Streptomyces sp. NPDC059193]|uniref:type IV secretory system conjugative DNA transfer family protein n=1 Tax=Streptomyces sp. NPDC059193 TaxID=3346763 RepID=UPI0036B682D7
MFSSSGDPHHGGGSGPGSGFDPVVGLVAVLGLVFTASGMVWLAAALSMLLSGGGWPSGDSLKSSPSLLWNTATGTAPGEAWHAATGTELGPVWLFWLLASALAVGLVVLAVWGIARLRGTGRKSLGAQWAGRSDEKRMVVPADPAARRGRLTVGHSQLTRRLLAAEPYASAIALGPNGSGKTVSLVVPNGLEWDGPAVITTAKGPDIAYIVEARKKIGPVHILSPVSRVRYPTASWSPVDYASTEERAERMARWLCEAAAMTNPDSKPWIIQARQYIAPLLLAAHHSGRGIDAFVEYIDTGKEAQQAVREQLRAIGAVTALRLYTKIWTLHADGIGSVQFTANTLIDAYNVPAVRQAAQSSSFDVEELLKGKGSLIIVAPPSESEALAPLFTAVIASVLHAAERLYEDTNMAANRPPGATPLPLSDPLLLDLDEAGNVFRYPGLAKLASTARGMGMQLLLIFHDIAQLTSLYGREAAGTIMSQCRLRIVLPALGDKDTVDHISGAFDRTVVYRASHTTSSDGRTSSTMAPHEIPLVAPHQIRQLERGHALVQYDNLPPMRVKLRNAETDKSLLALAAPETEPKKLEKT